MKEVIVKISLSEVCFGERDNMIIGVAEVLDKKARQVSDTTAFLLKYEGQGNRHRS